MKSNGKVVIEAGAFENGYANLKGGALKDLDVLAAKLRRSTLAVSVVDHTAADASEVYNAEMSLRRAEAVKCYLSGKGVDPHRVTTEGRGGSEPIASMGTARGRELNRRVEISVSDPE